MEWMAFQTGPGGTEMLVRPKPAELSAWQLRQALEKARRETRPEALEVAGDRRREFWMDTCREGLDTRLPRSRQVLQLHKQYGCCYCVPTRLQTQHVLDALDAALPAWDRDHPELFFRTLELNFPELMRYRRTQRTW